MVKPPQKPVAKNNVTSLFILEYLLAEANINPIKNDPKILAIKVPKGNEVIKLDLLIKKRNILPNPPPRKTNNNAFI